VLEEADEAIRQARARQRDWAGDINALLEFVVADAAKTIVSPPSMESLESDSLLTALRRALVQRDQMALEMATALKRKLVRGLGLLEQATPSSPIDPGPLKDISFRELPDIELSQLDFGIQTRRPWWAGVLPALAMMVTERKVHRDLGPELQQFLAQRDRQLQAWLNNCIGQLIELYEGQAQVWRERARQLEGDSEPSSPADKLESIRAALRELRETDCIKGELTHESAQANGQLA
jgi:hypothetical protein